MADTDYEKEYLEKKKKLKDFHKRLPQSKKNQEIYHKIMGSSEVTDDTSEASE